MTEFKKGQLLKVKTLETTDTVSLWLFKHGETNCYELNFGALVVYIGEQGSYGEISVYSQDVGRKGWIHPTLLAAIDE